MYRILPLKPTTLAGSILEHHRSADWAEKAYSNLFAMISRYDVEGDVRKYQKYLKIQPYDPLNEFFWLFQDYASQNVGIDVQEKVEQAKKCVDSHPVRST